MVVMLSSCCITAFAMAVAAAAVGAGAPFWTGEATIAGASIIGGMGVPALGIRHYVLIRDFPIVPVKGPNILCALP